MAEPTTRETLERFISTLTDDEKYKARLKEVTEIENRTAENVKTYSASAAKAEEDLKAARAVQELTAAQHNEIHQRLLPREAQVQKDKAILQQKQTQLDADTHDHQLKVDASTAELNKREAFITALETQVKAAQDKVDSDRARLDEEFARLARKHQAVELALRTE